MPLARRGAAAEGGDVEYLHVAARGRFHHDKERYLYAPASRASAGTSTRRWSSRPGRIVWVNRGFVPDA